MLGVFLQEESTIFFIQVIWEPLILEFNLSHSQTIGLFIAEYIKSPYKLFFGSYFLNYSIIFRS